VSRIIKAAEFKQTCLALMDEVAGGGAEVIITKRGKAVAKLVSVEDKRPQAFACLRDAITVLDEDFSLPE
jgi:prevent-host-death family protein